MKDLISPALAAYFFGDQFNPEVVNTTLSGHPNPDDLKNEILQCTQNGKAHFGIRFICYLDLDTGLFMCALQSAPTLPSMVSFFISSNHRFFGGNSLVCIPLQFCINSYEPEGEYLVYRHTFKKPCFDPVEIEKIFKKGTPEQRVKAIMLIRSREGYETIPGMSYVGLTKRSWQERYIEHTEKAMKSSGSTLFHKAVREMQGERVIHVHDVSAFGLSKKEATEYEKKLISSSTLAPNGLNMKVG